MKKIENNFVVTGFVGKDAEIRQFTNASVARFPLAVSRLENNGEESKRVSAFMNFEAWRKNENTVSIRPRACFFPLFSFLPLWLHYNLNPLCVQY